MESLEHPLLLVRWINALLGPVVVVALRPLGIHFEPGEPPIPDYLVMSGLVVLVVSVASFTGRSYLSVENPGKIQIIVEDLVGALQSMLAQYIGPKGDRYLSFVGTVGIFVLCANLLGLIPGLMSPTTNINVTLGCALTVWVYYHVHGLREQGLLGYVKHFAAPPGAPLWMAPIYFPIEIISHASRVLSLSVRLFGNIFGEELVIMILFSIAPFLVPLPVIFLDLITALLQAYIFVLLTVIYLAGAVATEGDHRRGGDDDHGAAAFGAA